MNLCAVNVIFLFIHHVHFVRVVQHVSKEDMDDGTCGTLTFSFKSKN